MSVCDPIPPHLALGANQHDVVAMVPIAGGSNENVGPQVEAAERSLAASFLACVDSVSRDRSGNSAAPNPDSMRALESCTGEYSIALRTAGAPPERVLVRLKELLRDAVKGPLKENAIADATITWCIKAYYAE